ncbi:YitT family protein [Fervidibacillus albus]|uniref:YitT family protein n=1 Tax=Fervidibacillus albus TaxID=2980026 RepID=A0A9E8LWF0_9BACI|nr:YitT family protein [Fervidibacillus albus]WAA10932.1 YitT family protein [Fervidibacillus albus]
MILKLRTYLILFFGAILQGFAMGIFLFPHSIPSGGAAGIAIIANHFFHVPLGFALWLANAVFFVFALQYFGFLWTIRTILSVATTSTVVSFIEPLYFFEGELFPDLLFGAVLFGVGVGLLIRVGASSGGMVIPALMIANYKNWNPGKVMFSLNFCIFLMTSIVIDYTIVFYAIVCQWISSHIVDFVYEWNFSKRQIPILSWRRK